MKCFFGKNAFLLLIIIHIVFYDSLVCSSSASVKRKEKNEDSASDLLSLGDSAMISDDPMLATMHYKRGIEAFGEKDSLMTALSLHTNLGTALSSVGDDSAAIEEYTRAVLMLEQHKDASVGEQEQKVVAQSAFFLGMAYEDTNKPERAVEAYVYATELDEMHWSAWANLGAVLFDRMKNPEKAIEAYSEAYSLLTTPSTKHLVTDMPAKPQYIISQIQYRVGMALLYDTDRQCAVQTGDNTKPTSCRELAANAFSTAVQYDSTNEAANHMLAGVTADASVKRASNEYVTELFENYATNFEHSLVKELGYNGYERLRAGFDTAMLLLKQQTKPSLFDIVVDAGCGTGLAGEQFRNISSYLIGMDLSPSILAEAKKLRPTLYNETLVGDVIELLLATYKQKIDLLIAADSYIYFGDLIPIMDAMKSCIKDGGHVAFTLENVDQDNESRLSESKPDWRWQLTASGRFAHRKDYVLSLAKLYSFRLLYYESIDGFRSESGKEVRGHLFVLKKESNIDKNEEL